VVTGLVLAGFGMGMLIPNSNILVMQMAPPSVRGREIGKLTTFWFFGQFVSPLLLLPFITKFSQGSVFGGIAILTAILSILFLFSGRLWRQAG